MLGLVIGAAATAGVATLHVGVHREAGTVYDIAADGATGQCAVLGEARIACPADGPVTFRWGPRGSDWALVGETTVSVDEEGEAWVLAQEPLRERERRWLADETTAEVVRTLFVRTAANPLPAPSRGLLDDLFALALHPDVVVRREVVRGLVPWLRHTASDPMSMEAPSLVPDGLLTGLAGDSDTRVRRRLARILREVPAGDQRAPEARTVLMDLISDRSRGVQRAAMASTGVVSSDGYTDTEQAWRLALGRVTREGPPGRAACNALAQLHGSVVPSETVDPRAALALILRHHPERAWRYWSAWREELPFEAAWGELLLRDTMGLSRRLLLYWAEVSPEALAAVITRWEPSEPHTERYAVVVLWLAGVEAPAIRTALDP